MPELPDIVIYIERLKERVHGRSLLKIDLRNPFLLRTATPPSTDIVGRHVIDIFRIGKRIVLAFESDLYLVIHLMIAGRLRWRPPDTKPHGGKMTLAGFHFENGVLFLTEAGTKRRASVHLIRGREGLAQFDRGGLEVLESSVKEFSEQIRSESHTIKRTLTDPRLISGIGNAYSDEILHRARLSPLTLTRKLSDDEIQRLFESTVAILTEWTDRLRREAGGGFPEDVTAFHSGMAVHGRFGLPCPACGAPVQRIRYAENETNYCARCQTGGRLLADRALSRLLKSDWPKSIDDLDQ